MTPYFLLRDNKQSGPYSIDQLKALGLRSTDLVWIEGASALWRYPNEIPQLSEEPIGAEIASASREQKIVNGSKSTKNENGTNVEVRHGLMEDNFHINEPGSSDPKEESPAADTGNGQPADEPVAPVHTGPIRVIIADDHSLFREGVKLALSERKDIEMIGEAETGVHLLNLLKHQRPDVILLDIEMPVMDGVAALKEIRKLYGNLKVIILSMHDTRSMVTTLMKCGANSYLSKSAGADTIYEAIKGVHLNDYHYTELSGKQFIEDLKKAPAPKSRHHRRARDKSDMMLKLREINKHQLRSPSRHKRKKSMLLLALAVVSAVIVFGIFYRIDQSPANKIMYAGPLPDSASPAGSPSIPEAQSNQTSGPTIHALLADQDSMLDNRQPIILGQPPVVKSDGNGNRPLGQKKLPKQMSAHKEESTPAEVAVAEPVTEKEQEKMVDSPVIVKDKALARYNLRNLLTVSSNDYSKGVLGGVSDIELSVTNNSTQLVDDVTIQLEYLLPGRKVFKTEILHTRAIGPQSTKIIKAPKSSRGVSIQFWITNFSAADVNE